MMVFEGATLPPQRMRGFATIIALSTFFRQSASDAFYAQLQLDTAHHSIGIPNMSDMAARIPGEVILGGLFSIRKGVNCTGWTNSLNIQLMEAMLYAVDEINRNPAILPSITLGAEIRDDCLSGTIALEETLNFILQAFGQNEQLCSTANKSIVMGVVGTGSSGTSIPVASLLRLFRLPQVSYAATSPDLSSREDFKYFTRTVPSDECQAEAILDVITNYRKWSAVFLISSSGNYGLRMKQAFVELAKANNVCIVNKMEIDQSKVDRRDEIVDFLLRINNTASVRGVVLLTDHSDTKAVLEGVQRASIANDRFLWLASDAWGIAQDLQGVEAVADGAITIALHTPNETVFEAFHKHFVSLKPGNNSRNPWFDLYWENHFNCIFTGNDRRLNVSKNCTGNETYESRFHEWKDDRVPYVIDSVFALAYSVDHMVRNTSGNWRERWTQLLENNQDLLDYLLETNFSGTSGNVSFDRRGNGMPRYDIMKYKNGTYRRITVWREGQGLGVNLSETDLTLYKSSCSEECAVGEIRVFLDGTPPCCWKCHRCSKNQFAHSSSQCQSCPRGERPYQNRTGCESLPESSAALGVVVILVVWATLGLLLTVFVAYTMYRFYSTPLIMATGRELMLVLLAGIALCYSLGFAVLGELTKGRCTSQRFGSGVFLAICYSAILVKTNRIARIFRGSHRPAFITPAPQLLITALIVSIQVGISLVASFFGTSSEVTRHYGSSHVYMICRTSGMEYLISISYNVLLVLLCTCYAFLTRKLPANFNEARMVGITMYATCAQWICFIPLFYGTNPANRTAVLLLNSVFNATVLLVGMFSQKVYIVWFRPVKNTRQASNPRGRLGSSGASAQSADVDDGIHENCGIEKGSAMHRFSSRTTIVSAIEDDF